jgi:hypothetical protein
MQMLNNEHRKAVDVGIAEMVSFVSQVCNLSLSEKMLNVDMYSGILAGKYLSNHFLFALDHNDHLLFSFCVLVLSNREMLTS